MTSLLRIVSIIVVLSACQVHAQDRLSQLEHELDSYAQEGHRERLGQGFLALALGGTLLPAGIVMTERKDELVRLIGIGTLVTGAVQLTRLPLLFVPSAMERLRLRHQRRKTSGVQGDALVAETERDWAEQAQVEHKSRKWSGAFNLGIGVATIPIGLAFMLHDHVGDLSHAKQINIGSTLLGVGVGFTAVAALILFSAGPSERSWKAHQLRSPLSFGVAPTATGAVLTAGGTF